MVSTITSYIYLAVVKIVFRKQHVFFLYVRSVHSSANLFFHFSNKNGKGKYYLYLSYLHILKYVKKIEKNKMVRKIDHFFVFSNFEVKFKDTKNTVNG